MGKKQLMVLVAAVAVIAGAWYLLGRDNNSTDSAGTNTNTAQSSSTKQQSAPTATDKVSIADMNFSPADITVKKGTTVTWTNQDSVAHTVTENDGKNGPSSPLLNQDKSYSFTFNEAGAFHYHCSLHPEMTGTVTVTE